jgi:hypothetical protein
MKRKPEPTPKPERISEIWRLSTGNRKPPISLPRIRTLETPEPNEKGDPEGLPKSDIRHNVEP